MKTKDGTEYNKKKIGRVILLFIVLVILLSNGVIRDKISNLVIKDDKTLEIINEINIESFKEYQLAIVGNKIITYNKEEVWGYDFKGEGQVIKEITINNPIIILDESYIYIVNKDSGEVQALNNEGKVEWGYKFDKRLDHGFTKGNHVVIISTTEEGYQEISIINSEGKLKGNTIIKNGQAVSADIYNDYDEVLIATINTLEQQIISNIIKYSKDGGLLWVETFKDEIIQEVKYMEDKSCIVITDKKIYHLNSQKELLWSRENKDDIWDVKINNDDQLIIVLFKNYLETIDFDGRTKSKIGLDEEFDRVEYHGETIYLQNNINILGIRGNNIFLKCNYEGQISSTTTTLENIILALEGKIRIMGMVRKN